jgi:hypothetical protein
MVSGSSEHEPPDEATVAAYLSNRLDPTRAQAFEAYCLRHPEFARRVELDLHFKVGFRQMLRPDSLRRTGHRRRTMLAIAAGFILVVGCGLLLLARVHPGALLAYRSATEVPSALLSGPRVSITLIRLRGDSAVHRVIAPRRAGVLAVRVAPDSPPGPVGYAMGIALEPRVMSRSVTLDNLHADAEGYLDVYLPLAGLVGQTLTITLNPSPSTRTESLSFRLQVAYAESTPADTP